MIVLACEGNTELILLQRLLEEGVLRFSRNELFDHRPLHSRQLREYSPMLATIDFDEDILIYRIGDTLREELAIPFLERRKELGRVQVFKICTKPEIEMLAILAKGWWDDYRKRRLMPKAYVRQFHNGFDFIDFLQHASLQELCSAIEEYRRFKRHNKDEGFLFDLLQAKITP